MSTAIDIGNVVRSTVTFTPESGTVALADLTCKVSKAHRYEVDVTASIESVSANVFRVDVETDESDPHGVWLFRWESSSPSARIAIEGSTTRFVLRPSLFRNP